VLFAWEAASSLTEQGSPEFCGLARHLAVETCLMEFWGLALEEKQGSLPASAQYPASAQNDAADVTSSRRTQHIRSQHFQLNR
jgi:hypothetical protein